MSWRFGVISINPKRFCVNRTLKIMFSFAGKGTDRSLKKVRLKFFKFSHFCLQNTIEQIMTNRCFGITAKVFSPSKIL